MDVAAFDRALGILDKYINNEKTKGAREQDKKQIAQWEGAKKRLQESKTMLADKKKALDTEIKRDPAGAVAQAFNDEGLTMDVLTIAKIDEYMNTTTKVNDIHMRDGLDTKIGKQVAITKNDIMTGKGRSVGIVRTLFGLGAASYATKGVTTLLANAGIISNPMGLMGLAKLVVPKLLTTVTSALTSFISFNPAGALLLGGALLVKLAPTIKRLVNKGVDFYKTMTSRKTASQNLLNEIENGPAPTGPAPTGPAPTGPAPTGPAPTGPAPTGPAPTGPAPTGPAPTGPAPTGPAPTGPAPRSAGITRFLEASKDAFAMTHFDDYLKNLDDPAWCASNGLTAEDVTLARQVVNKAKEARKQAYAEGKRKKSDAMTTEQALEEIEKGSAS